MGEIASRKVYDVLGPTFGHFKFWKFHFLGFYQQKSHKSHKSQFWMKKSHPGIYGTCGMGGICGISHAQPCSYCDFDWNVMKYVRGADGSKLDCLQISRTIGSRIKIPEEMKNTGEIDKTKSKNYFVE